MKIQKLMWIVMLVSCYVGIAYAENASGTITALDASSQNVTLRRADTSAMITVHVKDAAAFRSLTNGREVTMDANRSAKGWEARSLKTAPDMSSRQMADQGANSTTTTNKSGALSSTGVSGSNNSALGSERSASDPALNTTSSNNANRPAAVEGSTGY